MTAKALPQPLTSQSSKEDELEMLKLFVQLAGHGTYLEQLMSGVMASNIESNIRNDFACDIVGDLVRANSDLHKVSDAVNNANIVLKSEKEGLQRKLADEMDLLDKTEKDLNREKSEHTQTVYDLAAARRDLAEATNLVETLRFEKEMLAKLHTDAQTSKQEWQSKHDDAMAQVGQMDVLVADLQQKILELKAQMFDMLVDKAQSNQGVVVFQPYKGA